MVYANRQRADGFGAAAELYDRVRPSYPPELIADLLAGSPVGGRPVREILDVGSGTGKLARQLVGADRQVLGLEPDARMAAIATSHGITVEVATFETWDPAGRRFDLLTTGQSWHWVNPEAGAAKAMEVLRPGARFAGLWNGMHHTPEVLAVCNEVYARHVPQLAATSIVLGAGEVVLRRANPTADGLRAAGFVDVDVRGGATYRRTVQYSPAEWVELVSTHSDHAILDAAVREPLLADLQDHLAEVGPTFGVYLYTDAVLATRPDD